MKRIVQDRPDLGLLLLRVAAGGLMLTHGLQKLSRFSALSNTFPDPLSVGSLLSLSLAVFAEVLCAVLVVLGLFMRPALLPLLVTMGVAVGVIHAGDPWGRKELGVLYAALYLVLLLTGPGAYSVDAWLRRRGAEGAG